MPFSIIKQKNKNLYYVINRNTKQKYSKKGLPLDHAEAQLRALYANENGYKLSPSKKRYYSMTRKTRLSPLRAGSICWPGFHRVPGTKAYTKGSCKKN